MNDPLSLMNMTATIRTATQSVETSGAPSHAYIATAFNVPCSVNWSPGGEFFYQDRQAQRSPVQIIFPPAVTVAAKDRITVLSETFEVRAKVTRYDNDGAAHFIEVAAEEID